MIKRLIISILVVALASSFLCGCTFFSHDNDRDMQQIVAEVESYDIQNSVTDEDGSTRVVTYNTKAATIYKQDLVDYVNNNYSNLSSSASTAEGIIKNALSMLINIELVENEVDALIDAGLVEWGLTEKNAIKKNVYSVIDSTLLRLKNDILKERDKPQITTDGDSEQSSSTTYPVKEEEKKDNDEEEAKDTEPWEPSLSRYPGLTGDAEERSLGREAVRRFISLIKSRTKDDFRITADDREKFEADDKRIDEIIDTEGIEKVYPMLGDTHYIYYISGKDVERSQKIKSMRDYLSDLASVSDEEIIESFRTTLNNQRSSYDADISQFDSAMSGNSTVLYYPNDNYFYVKHILLPFSDEQKDALTAYKARINVSEEQVKAFRDNLVSEIVCYPHVDGEDDKTRPMTVDDVIDVVRAKMLPLAANAKNADLAFDDLIIEYNTDPGAFNNNKGYVVKYKLNDGESETYMQEFADGARYMKDNLKVGEVYYEPVVTDYGVHIMYFASETRVGEVTLDQYITPGELKTYYDVIKEPIREARSNQAYTKWENEVLSYNYDRHSTVFEKRYSDLWEGK